MSFMSQWSFKRCVNFFINMHLGVKSEIWSRRYTDRPFQHNWAQNWCEGKAEYVNEFSNKLEVSLGIEPLSRRYCQVIAVSCHVITKGRLNIAYAYACWNVAHLQKLWVYSASACNLVGFGFVDWFPIKYLEWKVLYRLDWLLDRTVVHKSD